MSDVLFGIAPSTVVKLRRLFEATPGLLSVWVFGSRATGHQREESDIDLAIAGQNFDFGDLAKLTGRIESLGLLYKVDTVLLSDQLDTKFRERIERDRQVFWAPRHHVVQAEGMGSLSLKKFQGEALEALAAYIDQLSKYAAQAQAAQQTLRVMEGMEDLAREAGDFPKKTWAALRTANALPLAFAAQPYSSRFDGAGRAIPNVCLKVPTGGGKTLLAAAAVGRVHSSWLRRHNGLVLWVVPNEAIYRQTLTALTNRDHPYRQLLNLAGAGRVKVLEKNSPLNRMDVEGSLCVMVLMLQAANRQSKETLRFFRDRGNVHGFLPAEDDLQAHWDLLREVPNLDAYGSPWQSAANAAAQMGSVVKSSLGNVMRLLRPMVIIDEGHHAYSEGALRTIDGFNPGFVLELSATPRKAAPGGCGSNILVDVRGTDLDEAQMIKLPIDVEVRRWTDWQSCLGTAVRRLDGLQQEAEALRNDTARYIRPILLVQVERTGADMRDAGLIHAEDAKAYLMQLGLSERQIAIKTSEKNDLGAPENIDLMAPTCEVRAIITKQALQEGWDCPFAYVLCALAAGRSKDAMTQLVGRILRLPHVAKTGRAALDGCYVLCHDANTGEVVKAIKKSLEREGMGDLAMTVRGEAGEADTTHKVALKRREPFAELRLFLPRVTCADESGGRRLLEYDSDILARLPWQDIRTDCLATQWAPDLQATAGAHLSLDLRLLDKTRPVNAPLPGQAGSPVVNKALLVRSLLDIAPNAWLVWEWVSAVLTRLLAGGISESKVAASTATLVEHLRMNLEAERDRLAQTVFEAGVAAGHIQFSLRADGTDFALPFEETLMLQTAPEPLHRGDGYSPVQKSLLEPALRTPDMNVFEAQFAGYLDERAALRWWHRNVAKAQYGLQGWRRHRVYPDFVFGTVAADGRMQVVVMETKGAQLANKDTAYKQALLAQLTHAWADDRLAHAGELALTGAEQAEVVCDLIFQPGWAGVLDARYFTAA